MRSLRIRRQSTIRPCRSNHFFCHSASSVKVLLEGRLLSLFMSLHELGVAQRYAPEKATAALLLAGGHVDEPDEQKTQQRYTAAARLHSLSDERGRWRLSQSPEGPDSRSEINCSEQKQRGRCVAEGHEGTEQEDD